MILSGRRFSVESAEEGGIYVREAATMDELGGGERTKVWTDTGMGEVWAPEIMSEGGRTYIYFAAGKGAAHRMYGMYIFVAFYISSKVTQSVRFMYNTASNLCIVISSDSPRGQYSNAQKLNLPDDKWAIDGIYFRYNGQGWFAWSGWKDDPDRVQRIYLCRMSSPTQPTGPRYIISEPREQFELINTADAKADKINEGPQAIVDPEGRLHIVYSVNHSWEDQYCLAELRLKAGGDPTKVWDWYKSNGCLFGSNQATMMKGWDATQWINGPGKSKCVHFCRVVS